MAQVPYTKDRCLKTAVAELVDDYASLKREADDLRDHNKYLESCLDDRNAEMMLHVRLYEALVEAVRCYFASCLSQQAKCADEMSTEEYRTWHKKRQAARATVDALVEGHEQETHSVNRPNLRHAFLQGAKFWEFHKEGGTMWQSDQRLCATRAKEMEADGTLGVDAVVGEG